MAHAAQIPRNPPPELAPLAGTRIMQLDQTGNIHSVWPIDGGAGGHTRATNSYWDILAALPWLADTDDSSQPGGAFGILGLVRRRLQGSSVLGVPAMASCSRAKCTPCCSQGAGTVARLVHAWRPEQRMEGWELDSAVIMAARTYMGERWPRHCVLPRSPHQVSGAGRPPRHRVGASRPRSCSGLAEVEQAGVLTVHDGADALAPPPPREAGKLACAAVDVFGEGTLPEALTQDAVWRGVRARLADPQRQRVMVNLAQPPGPSPFGQRTHQVLLALQRVFGGEQVLGMSPEACPWLCTRPYAALRALALRRRPFRL